MSDLDGVAHVGYEAEYADFKVSYVITALWTQLYLKIVGIKYIFECTFKGTVPANNQLEIYAYVPRCRRRRRGRYCYFRRLVRIFYRYEF